MYKIEFMDGEWVVGERGFRAQLIEPITARRVTVTNASEKMKHVIGKEFNFPIKNVRYHGNFK